MSCRGVDIVSMELCPWAMPRARALRFASAAHFTGWYSLLPATCVEINQCVGSTRQARRLPCGSSARRAPRRLLAVTQRPRLTTARLLSDSLTSVIKPARSLSSLRCLAKKYANANYAIISCGRAQDFIYLLQQPTTDNSRGSSPSSREKKPKLRHGSLAFGKTLAKPKLEGRIARQMLLFSKLSK